MGDKSATGNKVSKKGLRYANPSPELIAVGFDLCLSLLANIGAQMLFYGALAMAGRSLALAGLVLG
jgi:hypothetical protein